MEHAGSLRRRWDSYDVYLFDIDGTLLQCTDAVHYFAFCDALTHVAGRAVNLDGVVAHGNTDVGILRDAFRRAGVEDEAWRPRLPELRRRMCGFVEQQRDGLRVEVLPGVRDVLGHLRRRGALLGVATGNLEGIGRLKLERAGLLESFAFGGFSDAYETREGVFGGAMQQAFALSGRSGTACVVGDTPADVRAARAHGLDAIATATGIYSAEELRAERPGLCVASLTELLRGWSAED